MFSSSCIQPLTNCLFRSAAFLNQSHKENAKATKHLLGAFIITVKILTDTFINQTLRHIPIVGNEGCPNTETSMSHNVCRQPNYPRIVAMSVHGGVCLSPRCNFLTESNGNFWLKRIFLKILNQVKNMFFFVLFFTLYITKPPTAASANLLGLS